MVQRNRVRLIASRATPPQTGHFPDTLPLQRSGSIYEVLHFGARFVGRVVHRFESCHAHGYRLSMTGRRIVGLAALVAVCVLAP